MNEKATWKKWFVPVMFALMAFGGAVSVARSCSERTPSQPAAEGSSAP